jgi:FkbM family methyltransferase
LAAEKIIPLAVKYFHRIFYTHRWKKFHDVLLQRMAQTDEFFFIEIGANDGISHDRIFDYVKQYRWRGILVEPVKYYFDKLVSAYSFSEDLIFANVAISDREETKAFHRIKEGIKFLPEWSEGLGSFYLDVLLKHRWAIPRIEDYLVTEQVQCISFNTLVEKYGVKKIDLLLVDTEGYDYGVIQQINFARLKPAIIVYEHKHLSRQDKQACAELLKRNGYLLERRLGNTLAYLAS